MLVALLRERNGVMNSVLRSGLRVSPLAHFLLRVTQTLSLPPETSLHLNSRWLSRDKVFVTQANLELEATHSCLSLSSAGLQACATTPGTLENEN